MIALDSIYKRYAGNADDTLADLCLNIERGEYLAVQGGPGSGKSVLLRILGLLERPSSGGYRFDDFEVAGLPDAELSRIRRERFGFVLGGSGLLPELTAGENVELPMAFAGLGRRSRSARSELLLDRLGLQHCRDRRASLLTAQERQRAAIARALANEPDLILADEPLSGLSRGEGEGIAGVLESLNDRGLTLVVFTRSEDLASRARRVERLRSGRLVGAKERAAAGDIRA